MTTIARLSPIGRLALPWRATVRASQRATHHTVAHWVLVSSASLPLVLTSAWLVAGTRQPRSYSPVRQTVSVLSGYGGTDRWIVTAALYVIGFGYLMTAAGLSVLTMPSRLGLVVAGAAAIGVASFPVPAHGTSRAHAMFTAFGALAITIWPLLVARQESVIAAVGPRVTVAAVSVSVALFVWTVIETHNGSALGLAERVSSGLQACWPFVVALALRRASAQPVSARTDLAAL